MTDQQPSPSESTAAGVSGVDEYIKRFPDPAQTALQEVRRRIHAVVPGAGEAIRYDMPTITLDGRSLIHFAGWKRHLSLYPVPDGDPEFERDIAPFRSGKSTAKFGYAHQLPAAVIERVVTLLVEQRRRPES